MARRGRKTEAAAEPLRAEKGVMQPKTAATGTLRADGDGRDGDTEERAVSGRETEISLDGDTLGEIARLIDIQTLGDSYMIREELERDD